MNVPKKLRLLSTLTLSFEDGKVKKWGAKRLRIKGGFRQ